MDGLIHTEEEITDTTIENDSQIVVFETVQLVDNRMIVPCIKVLIAFADILLHPPVVRKRPNVKTATGTTYGTEYVFVADSIPHGTVSTHAEAGNGTLASVRNT